MVYNIKTTYESGLIGFVSIIKRRFCLTTNRQCVVWFKKKETAERVIKKLEKKWHNVRKFKLQEFERVLR